MFSSLENWLNTWNSYSFEKNIFSSSKIKQLNFFNKFELNNSFYLNKIFWSFNNVLDVEWLLLNLSLVEDLEIVVFDSEDFGIVFTVLGDSENLYKTHWHYLFNVRKLPINFFDY